MFLQAKSPVRTLDELSVTEVASSPYFPSISERKQSSHVMEDSFDLSESGTHLSHISATSDHLKTDNLDSQPSVGFGVRRVHRSLVVTARARSFLYHQVSFN